MLQGPGHPVAGIDVQSWTFWEWTGSTFSIGFFEGPDASWEMGQR